MSSQDDDGVEDDDDDGSNDDGRVDNSADESEIDEVSSMVLDFIECNVCPVCLF